MLGSQPPDVQQRERAWRLAYFRSNALVGLLLSLGALSASLLVFVPSFVFLVAALALGVFLYISWVVTALRPHLFWLVPAALVLGVYLAVEASHGAPRTMATVQFVASFAIGLFACLTLERVKRVSTHEPS
jgi:hypothetical protein